MKTSLALLLSIGFCYLYVLEELGNFIESNLHQFKESLDAQKYD